MAQIDLAERRVTLKIVYTGPPASGKTTNLRAIHARIDSLNRGHLMLLDSNDDRTLFFDLLPIFFRTSGLSFRVRVYTVPGQPKHKATQRVVLRETDGVVFVADSRAGMNPSNRAAYQDLLRTMNMAGLAASVPVVAQYNKQDLDGIVKRTHPFADDQTVFAASATEGDGVMDTFLAVLTAAWDAVDAQFNLSEKLEIDREPFLARVTHHLIGERGSD